MEDFLPVYFFVVVFFVLSLIYLWPLVAEVIGGVQKTREGKPARWERFLNVFVLPFLVVAAAFAARTVSWIPPWYAVLALALLVDLLAFAGWWATCVITARVARPVR